MFSSPFFTFFLLEKSELLKYDDVKSSPLSREYERWKVGGCDEKRGKVFLFFFLIFTTFMISLTTSFHIHIKSFLLTKQCGASWNEQKDEFAIFWILSTTKKLFAHLSFLDFIPSLVRLQNECDDENNTKWQTKLNFCVWYELNFTPNFIWDLKMFKQSN